MLANIERFVQRINRWRMRKISNRNFLVFLAVLVGIVSGLAAALLKGMTHRIATFLQDDVQIDYKYYLYLLFPLTGILLSVLYVRKFVRGKKMEHGITPIIYAISRRSSKIPVHNSYSQIITSAITVGFGGSAGLEAPVAYAGSAIGSNMGSFFGLNYREITLLLACGAAAGIAGAFNSPIAGMIFAIEILLPEFSIPAFIPLLMAVATSSVISKTLYSEPLFHLVTEDWAMNGLFFYIILAVTIGVYSVYFAKISTHIKRWFDAIKNPYHKVWISGAGLGILIFLFPALYGEGYLTIQQILDGRHTAILSNSIFAKYEDVGIALLFFVVLTALFKSIASLITLNSGGNGGIFGPSLVMGGLLGFAFSYGINLTGWAALNIVNFTVVGMAAALGGIMHAPLTAIFLIAEITGGYVLMVPLMIATAISYLINKIFMKHSIYTKILAEKGDLLSHEDKDGTVLSMMKLRYLLEKNFTVLKPFEKAIDRRYDIIHTKRNIFPVVDETNKFLGIVHSEQLLEILLGDDLAVQHKPVHTIMQKPVDTVNISARMDAVMQKMNREDVWMLPVIDDEGKYLGFISKSAVFNKYRALLTRQAEYYS